MTDIVYPWQAWYTDNLIRWGLKVVTPTTEEPITLAEAAEHLRIDAYGSPAGYPEATLIESTITAARCVCEGLSGLALAPQTYELGLGRFPSCWDTDGLSLHIAPVLWVVSVTYVDADGVTQTIDPANYVLDDFSLPARLYPAYGYSGPSTRTMPNAVRVRFVAGYSLPTGSPQDAPLPGNLRAAMLLTLGHLYENRSAVETLKFEELPMGVAALLEQSRIRTSMA